ncbi:NAD-dependent epimerase/dehydratase family protein [Solimonas terrae]|uniref:NAD-dependent epimerase/dehydratase family protein n=1 Tax=Solimonas terrae TaxID=1396819 RepID=A0A6M2BXJ6_9GAMM|nr:NAD-dependent epimerase/dehydratase family protein [Solimonas terrae]
MLGAGGLVGHAVVEALSRADWAFPIVASHRRRVTGSPAAGPVLDACDEAALSRAMENVDAVVNCVAGDARTITGTAQALATVATRQVLEPRVIHLSSMAVYGSAVGVVDESAPLKGDIGAYSIAKIQAERSALAYGHTVILRPGCIYGPTSSQWSLRIARCLIRGRLGELRADGAGYCNLIYIDDLAAVILRALTCPAIEGQTFNLATSGTTTWNQYFEQFAEALGLGGGSSLTREQLWLEMRCLAPLLKIAELVARQLLSPSSVGRIPPALPPSLFRLFRQRIRLDTGKAERILALAPTPVHEALRATAASMRELEASALQRPASGRQGQR